MNISFWLNGVYRQEEIEPGMLLIDFFERKRMLQRQKEAVKLQIVDFVQCWLKTDRFFHVPHWLLVLMEKK